MVYEYANEKQTKVLKVMEERLNALNEDPTSLTLAQEAWFYQMDLLERERIGKEAGKKIGQEIGKQDGKKDFLIKALNSKFQSLSETTRETIMNASPDTIDLLVEELFNFQGEEDLIAFLQKHSI